MKKILMIGGVFLGILVLVWAIKLIRFQIALKKIHTKECFIENGMELEEVYKILDSKIRPVVDIRFNRRDSIYIHTVTYPPMWNSETPFSMEFNPYDSRVINHPKCK